MAQQLAKKNIKQYIYDTLKLSVELRELVDERIYLLEDDYRSGEDMFPMITYCRISPGQYSPQGKRAEFFQISAWAETNMQAEEIKDMILDIFSRRANDGFVNYVKCFGVNESQDKTNKTAEKELKIQGIHSDFLFIMRDNL